MNKNKKIKVSVLRLLAFTLCLCLVSVVVFALSEALFERLSREVDPTSDSTKNARWLLQHGENLMLFPVLALTCLVYGKRESAYDNAIRYKEKKIAFILLVTFLYFVFLPYYVTQNMSANTSVFEALGDKAIWFATQLIPLSAIIMYHSDRQTKCLAESEEYDGEE